MSSIFQKINAAAPRALRPVKAARTKLAGFAPIVATKKFVYKSAAAIAKPFVKVYVRLSKGYRNMRLPSLRRENPLEREVGKQLFKRGVAVAEDVQKAMVHLGKTKGTKEQAEEARRLMQSMTVVQKQLEEYAQQAEASESRLDQHLGMVDSMLSKELASLKDMSWKDYQSRIRGHSNSRIVDFQSLHQLVYGTNHIPVRDRSITPLEGLRTFVREAQARTTRGPETDLEYAMKQMRNAWEPHMAAVDAEIKAIVSSHDRSKTRRLQHLMAAKATKQMLDNVIDAPNPDAARQVREGLVSDIGDMLGLRQPLSTVDRLLREDFPDGPDEGSFPPDDKVFPRTVEYPATPQSLGSPPSYPHSSQSQQTAPPPTMSPSASSTRPRRPARKKPTMGVRLDDQRNHRATRRRAQQPAPLPENNEWFDDWLAQPFTPGGVHQRHTNNS